MDKIYSRKRIGFCRNKGKRKKKGLKKILITTLFCIFIVVICIWFSAYPIFVASCKTAATSKANHIVNQEIQQCIKDYTYNDLIEIEKDSLGNIILVKYNTILINKITTQIADNIQSAIDNTPRIMVYMNFGSISGISILKDIGPKFDIELEAAGRIDTEIKSEFQSINVNQTSHKIYLQLNTNVNILTPFGVYDKNLLSKVLLTEAVIVGKVPETYYNLEGLKTENTLDVID